MESEANRCVTAHTIETNGIYMVKITTVWENRGVFWKRSPLQMPHVLQAPVQPAPRSFTSARPVAVLPEGVPLCGVQPKTKNQQQHNVIFSIALTCSFGSTLANSKTAQSRTLPDRFSNPPKPPNPNKAFTNRQNYKTPKNTRHKLILSFCNVGGI